MDTLEAKSTIIALWPTNFRTPQWQQQLVDLLETWDGMERRQVIEALKKTHQGKRVTLETLRSARGLITASASAPSGSFTDRLRTTEDWLESIGLGAAFRHADIHLQIDITRLVWVMLNVNGWQQTLEQMAGDASFFDNAERIENLAYAANRATINGYSAIAPMKARDGTVEFRCPAGSYEVKLPPPPPQRAYKNRMDMSG